MRFAIFTIGEHNSVATAQTLAGRWVLPGLSYCRERKAHSTARGRVQADVAVLQPGKANPIELDAQHALC